jgi:tetratricopeptide (TPR) repeat protein
LRNIAVSLVRLLELQKYGNKDSRPLLLDLPSPQLPQLQAQPQQLQPSQQLQNQQAQLELSGGLLSTVLGEEENVVTLSLDDPQVQEAMRYFNRALEAEPKDPCTLYYYAKFLWQCDQIDKAEKFFLRSLEAEPNYIVALEDYGRFLLTFRKDELGSQFIARAQKLRKLKSEQQGPYLPFI